MSSVRARKSQIKEHNDIHQIIENKDKISRKIKEIDDSIFALNEKINALLHSYQNKEAEIFKEKYPVTKKGLTYKIFKLQEEYDFHNK